MKSPRSKTESYEEASMVGEKASEIVKARRKSEISSGESNEAFHEVDTKEVLHSARKLKNCSYCNRSHIWGKTRCSSFGKRCSFCGVLNHCEDACYWKYPELLENNNRHF